MTDFWHTVVHGDHGQEGGESGSKRDLNLIRTGRIFERALVVKTLCDPANRGLAPDTLDDNNINLYETAPRNSIVCRRLTDYNADVADNTVATPDIVCFPFFSSHVSMPIKAGEQVWIFNEFLMRQKEMGRTYWISRVPESIALEDANFTSAIRSIIFSDF